MSGEITSVLIRKLGGWKMISVAKWLGYKPERRAKLLAQEHVQFFAGKVSVPPESAQVMLGLEEPTFDEPGNQPMPTHAIARVQEVSIAHLVDAAYRRYVQKDGRWVIVRNAEHSAAQELYSVRGHPSPAAYDVGSSDGMTTLSADLLADALGFDQDGLACLSNDSIGHFRFGFVEPVLGSREWETSAAQIRTVLERNPYLKIVRVGW